ncbi:tRNA (adenosine(37)-N6)-threonylcarbamoyltransferase complex dimerization subunit type 1 TsaB [Alkalihalobacillus sp. 1P02AB]|uniref:tRNA (adenosine(37)-N6)-threonylcarbamoyltransferase complex dimerization subunit type 1 TsaB n=1 Tax=Alkalihalobacillus sp. 1P02AB TaxID=3132260 RepID=UPI0039A46D6A
MSKVLAIDTSSFVLGVAIMDGERVLGEIVTNSKKNHALRLMPAISKLMEELKVAPKELERIVVANGPGSYTGVRIGVTTAKTLAWSLNIPLVMVSSIEVMAQAGRFYPDKIVPLIDARRGQVYTGLYEAYEDEVKPLGSDKLVLLSDWLNVLKAEGDSVLFVGQDVELHRDVIVEALGDKANFAPVSVQLPRPTELGLLGQKKEVEADVHVVTPQYLQLAEAEAKWKAAQEGKSHD